MVDPPHDSVRWAEAQSVLDRAPTESAEQRLRRWRQFRLLLVAAITLVTVALVVVVFVVWRGRPAHSTAEVATWQIVLGVVVAGAGLVFQCYGLVLLLRRNRRFRGWRSPTAVLTGEQQKELRSQVRGMAPLAPDRLPLARYFAESMVAQRLVLLPNVGLGIAFVGQWVLSPSTWRLVTAIGYGLLLAIGWPLVQRDARRARRFLAAHPPPSG